MRCKYFSQWALCDNEHKEHCNDRFICYKAEEEYLDYWLTRIEQEGPGEPERYLTENYEGSDDQI